MEESGKILQHLPVPRELEDEFVWVWSTLETSWGRVLGYVANTFQKTHPERYTHWLPDHALPKP